MSESQTDRRHGMGGNNPPVLLIPTPEDVRGHWADQTVALRERLSGADDMVKRFTADVKSINDTDTQGRAADVVAQVAKHLAAVEDLREKARRPWLDGGNAVQALFTELKGIVGSTAPIQKMQTAYAKLVEERNRAAAEAAARKAREEADRLEAEAASSLASSALDAAEDAATRAAHALTLARARPAEHSRIQSDMGTTSSLAPTVEIKVTDLDMIPPKYVTVTINEAQLRRDALAAYKANQPFSVPGVELIWDRKIRNYAR